MYCCAQWGFAMGWNYTMQWAVVLPLELVVAGLVMDYLDTGVPVAYVGLF